MCIPVYLHIDRYRDIEIYIDIDIDIDLGRAPRYVRIYVCNAYIYIW